MLKVGFIGSNKDKMEEFAEFIRKSLVDGDKISINNPESFGNKFVIRVSVGQSTDIDHEVLVDYDNAFFEKDAAQELSWELRKFWN